MKQVFALAVTFALAAPIGADARVETAPDRDARIPHVASLAQLERDDDIVQHFDRRLADAMAGGALRALRLPDQSSTPADRVSFEGGTPAGDLDGNGLDDVVVLEGVGLNQTYREELVALDGQTGVELYRFRLPMSEQSPDEGLPWSCFVTFPRYLLIWEVTGDTADDFVTVSFGSNYPCSRTPQERRQIDATVVDGRTGEVRWSQTVEGSRVTVAPEVGHLYLDWPNAIDFAGAGTSAELMVSTLNSDVLAFGGTARIDRLNAASGQMLSSGSIPFQGDPVWASLAGDLDADGEMDLSSTQAVGDGVVVRAHAASGATQWSASIENTDYAFVWSKTADGDGLDVVAYVGLGQGRAVFAWNGSDGSELWSMTVDPERALTFVPDRDGDGWLDIALTWSSESELELVLYSSADLRILESHTYAGTYGDWAWLEPTDDHTGDGIRDFLLREGAGFYYCPRSADESQIERSILVDGVTFGSVWTASTSVCSGGLWSLGADLDGDGAIDIQEFDGELGRARIASGRDLTVLLELPATGEFAWTAPANLTDGDRLDLVVFDLWAAPGSSGFIAYRGDGSPLWARRY